MTWILWVAIGIYLANPVLSLIYLVVLLPRDVQFVGFERWYAARFELISTRSRYAKAWDGWAGQGLWGYMLTHGADAANLRHEARHCWWNLVAGGYYSILWGADWLRLRLFTDRDPYRDNVCERDARRHAGQPV